VVPKLQAVNKGPWPVFIFDGEELVCAKQNRIASATILVRWQVGAAGELRRAGPLEPPFAGRRVGHVCKPSEHAPG
jgi:hypothetical protein